MKKLLVVVGLAFGLTGCAANGDGNIAANASAAACRSVDFEPNLLEFADLSLSIMIRFDSQNVSVVEGASGCSRSLTSSELSSLLSKAKSIATCSTSTAGGTSSLNVQNNTRYLGIDNPTATNVTVNGGYAAFHSQLMTLKNDVLSGCALP